MKTLQLKPGLYWTGILDSELRVFDIIMHTEFGTTYNSYVLKGSEKTALFETAKVKFLDEYLAKLQEVVDIQDIDYIIVNHTEPDHAGSVEKLLDLNPNIKVVGTNGALNFLKEIVNRDFYSLQAKDDATLSLGDKTLRFMHLPNLHWPDTMYTYIEEDQVLLTCDSFGSHYSHPGILRSAVTDEEGYMRATKYYFDNIIGPFKQPYMQRALERIKDLPLAMICPGHGPVLDSHIEELKQTYADWCTVVNPNTKKTVVMPYVSAYGYTRELAAHIAKGIEDSGDVCVKPFDMVESDPAAVQGEIAFADGLLFGTPTIIGEALKPIWDLTTSMFAPVHGGKLASAFGSYGWSGEGVPHILERLKQLKLKVVDGYRVRFKPSQRQLTEAYEFGYDFGCILQNKENDKKQPAQAPAMVKCLVCGEVFPAGTEACPVCGVGPENFVPVETEAIGFKQDTKENFVILGGGAAALNAATEIRKRNATCSIKMISNEPGLPYNRPMLTKNLLAGMTNEQIAIHDKAWYEEQNISLLNNNQIAALDPQAKQVTLADGSHIPYDKCVYALGAECFVPPIPGADQPEVIAIRRLTDVQKIASILKTAKNIVLIGGGILGLEAAWELQKTKCPVTVLEAAPRLMGRLIDSTASEMLMELAKERGIKVRTNVEITAIEGGGQVSGVRLACGDLIPADLVVVSAGVRANVQIAQAAGIEVGRAIKVNAKMETSLPDIYAAGDCAEYQGVNYAVWPQATEMGKTAGANAAGDSAEYQPITPAVTFSQVDTHLYAIGDNGARPDVLYKTVGFKDPGKKTLENYYFVNNRLAGGVLIGDLAKMAELTTGVEENKPFKEFF